MNSFEELEVWEKARDLRVFVSSMISDFPVEERFVLISQVKKSSRSIGNNIAEGFGRSHFEENIQFCRQARGALFETLDHMIVAYDEGWITLENLKGYREYHYDCLKLLNGYISSLKRNKKVVTNSPN
ncbi:four helix bundle protein [Echinicola salinicaeni]|uniref:four helix bundle protein n=1 Tax=Echinicola salinicaeni TaxID=2762757 RepID=UPI0016444BD5|nr:four helix bundle protein [Echinicola salinicaeni]